MPAGSCVGGQFWFLARVLVKRKTYIFQSNIILALRRLATIWGDKEALPYGVVCRTFLPIRFLPLNPRFRQTLLLPAPTQYFEQLATACKTQLDRGSLLRHEIPTNFGDCFFFVALAGRDWRRQRRLRVYKMGLQLWRVKFVGSAKQRPPAWCRRSFDVVGSLCIWFGFACICYLLCKLV